MAYKIDTVKCVGCGACEAYCPCKAITIKDGKGVIDSTKCQDCGSCAAACQMEAVSADK
jgi:ferredoxin